jgi:hypothetical protein
MRRGLGVLLLAAVALAGPEEEIARIFEEPASLPGKLSFDGYLKVLAAKGYPKPREDVNSLRAEVAGYLGPMLTGTCEVRRIRVAEDGASATAVVSLGGDLMRWFLVKDRGRWWYTDFEEVQQALRFSDWNAIPDWLRKAMRTDDEGEAVEVLLEPPDGKRSASVEVVRLVRLAYCLWIVDRDREALDCCTKAAALANAPGIEYMRACAAISVGEYEVAVKAANNYLDAVGDDPDGCDQLGRALRWLKRGPEAVAAHLRGLKTDPRDADNLVGLFRALPDDGKAPAVEQFLKLDDLPAWFAYLGAVLTRGEDWASLDALLGAYRGKRPDDAEIKKYEAFLLCGRKKYAEAAPLFLPLLKGREPEDRAYIARVYIHCMHGLGKPLDAYANLPAEDRERAWSYLAELLAYDKDATALDSLLAQRRDHPDVALSIWEIELRWIRKEYAEVDAFARKCIDTIGDSEEPERWRAVDRQARSLLRLGKAEEALAVARRGSSPVLLFAVLAGLGRNDDAASTLETALAKGKKISAFEGDEDAGPALRGDPFAALRAKHTGESK